MSAKVVQLPTRGVAPAAPQPLSRSFGAIWDAFVTMSFAGVIKEGKPIPSADNIIPLRPKGGNHG